MKVKSVQYLMGHGTSAVTLDVYTDSNLETVNEDMMLLQRSS